MVQERVIVKDGRFYHPTDKVIGMIAMYKENCKSLNEKERRRSIGRIRQEAGPGSDSYIAKELHCSRNTIKKGLAELSQVDEHPDKIRKPGAGRPRKTDDPLLVEKVRELVANETCGDPCSERKWTSMSLSKIRAILLTAGLVLSRNSVKKILKFLKYSRKMNRKMNQCCAPHPKRNDQFLTINRLRESFLNNGLPCISIDTKKKEILGNYSNKGTVYTPEGEPLYTDDHDFETNIAVPYGIYDVSRNHGFVVLGTSRDTAEFSTNCLDLYFEEYLKEYYPGAREVLILCDGGGSNGSRSRLWKKRLKELADKHQIEITVCHYPPGTSKYNPVEHRLFSEISKNWQGLPLLNLETAANLIASTHTRGQGPEGGLTVETRIDKRVYKTGLKVEDEELTNLDIEYFGEVKMWNYTIFPNPYI